MGLLDGMLGNALGSVLGGGQESQAQDPLGSVLSSLAGGDQAHGNNLMAAAMAMIQQNGGLNGILDAFRRNGMASHVDSWVGRGSNSPISPEQLEQAVGGSTLSRIASELGVSPAQAGSSLAQLLPELINQITPHGSVPENHNDLISQALSALRG